MATNYPTGLDALTNPTATDKVATVDHASQHANINDAVEALQAKVGVDSSAVTTAHDYKLSQITSTNKAVASPAFGTDNLLTKTDGTGQVVQVTGVSMNDNNDVTGLGLQNDAYLTGRNNADSGDVDIIKLTTGDKVLIPELTLTTALDENEGGTGTDTYTKGDILIASDANTLTKLAVGANDLGLIADSGEATGLKWSALTSVMTGAFGGDGSDGALSVSSGTTTIDLSNAAYVVKNYTSISITGTGGIDFSNPHANGTIIILKSQGSVTMTTSGVAIDTRLMGATGGTNYDDGETGNTGTGLLLGESSGGGGAQTPPTGGVAGATITSDLYTDSAAKLIRKNIYVLAGSGGGSGEKCSAESNGTNTTAVGGFGGGGLYIECAGALNFTTGSINTSGQAGGDGVDTSSGNEGNGAGGGGGAGTVVILYNTLTANSGTITSTGGAGGAGGDATGGTGVGGGSGGGAGSIGFAGGAGAEANASPAAGGAAAGAGAGGGGGGAIRGSGSGAAGGAGGATLTAVVTTNTEFV